jgi:hypothetical protein
MTEQEAKEKCAKLSAESPERTTHSWVPRKGDDGQWSIAKLAVPTPGSLKFKTKTEEDVQAIQEDPRTSTIKNIGGWIG